MYLTKCFENKNFVERKIYNKEEVKKFYIYIFE